MARTVSGKRYAQAIFELGLERDRLDQWASDLEFIDGVLQDAEFRAFLQHADVPIGDKVKAIEAVLSETEPLIRNMVNLLVSKGLLGVMEDLRSAYIGLLDEHRGLQRVQVTSAVPLEQGELDADVVSTVEQLTGLSVNKRQFGFECHHAFKAFCRNRRDGCCLRFYRGRHAKQRYWEVDENAVKLAGVRKKP